VSATANPRWPGLLQTRAYATTVLGLADVSGQRDLEAAEAARLARQRILEQHDPTIEVIVAEAALCWSPPVGKQLWSEHTPAADQCCYCPAGAAGRARQQLTTEIDKHSVNDLVASGSEQFGLSCPRRLRRAMAFLSHPWYGRRSCAARTVAERVSLVG
ncbi:MAG: Scr1 family TA system antitoxin-like transcriptional regulator, partial [Pseudonocardiaceae bacterium]